MLVKLVVCTWILWMGVGVQERVTWHRIQVFNEGDRSAEGCLYVLGRVQPIKPEGMFQCLPQGTVPDGYQPPTVRGGMRLR